MSISNISNEKPKNIIPFTKKETCYYKMIDKFFVDCTDNQIKQMLDIINKESEISLRILDWFVTRYSKKRVDIDLGIDDMFDVHISYKAQLKSYKKTYFDPFRRRKKFYYNYDKTNNKKTVYTTLGQLNFFRWAISNNIIEYVEQNLSSLTKAMNASNKEDKKKKQHKSDSSSDDSDLDDYESDDDISNNINENKDEDKDKISESSKSSKSHKSKDKKITVKNNKKKINISASEDINDDEIQIILNFD